MVRPFNSGANAAIADVLVALTILALSQFQPSELAAGRCPEIMAVLDAAWMLCSSTTFADRQIPWPEDAEWPRPAVTPLSYADRVAALCAWLRELFRGGRPAHLWNS